jgi:DtxR family Mn-dependent transcriptional regulator
MTVSVENFVKTIYQLGMHKSEDTRPGSISKALGISNAATTDMARKLAGRNLVNYEKYRDIQLTSEGRKLALNVIRKHRLWETFLYRVLDLSLFEIHREAELLEHQTSDFMADKISQYLGNPSVDPHGDPIPDALGKVTKEADEISLTAGRPGKLYRISRIGGGEEEFFDFCQTHQIEHGTLLRIEKQYSQTKMTGILIDDVRILLNSDFANQIRIKENKA